MRTSSRASIKRFQAGFTVLEMGAVVAIMALLATGVIVRIDSVTAGEGGRALREHVVRVANLAASEAVARGRTVEVTYDEGGRRFTARLAERAYPAPLAEADSGDATGLNAATSVSDASAASGPVLAQARVPEGWDTSTWELAGELETADQWRIRFFPDGTQDAGGVGFSGPSGAAWSWSIPPRGASRVRDGDLPVAEPETWSAGELEQRGG